MTESLRHAWSRNYRFVVLIASLLLLVIGAGAMFALVIALKSIAAEFGWPRAVPSLGYSLQFIGGGLGGIAMGYWLDRRGMAGPATLSGFMIGLGAVATAFVATEWQFYLVWGVLMGLLGQSTLFTPLIANVMRWFAVGGGGGAVGFVASGQSLAGALWPPLFRYLNETIGWRDTFLWYGVFAICTMVPLSLLLRREPGRSIPSADGAAKADGRADAPRPSSPSSMRDLGLSTGQLQVVLSAAIIGCCIAMSLPLAHLVAYASDLGISTARAAEMLSLMLLMSFVSRMFGVGPLTRRLGGLRALFVFSSVQAVMLAALALVDGVAGLYVVAAVYGLGYGGLTPCYPVCIREYMPGGQVGRQTGIVIFWGTVGMAIGGWLGGFVYDLTASYEPAFFIGAGTNAVNLTIIAALIRRARARGALVPAVGAA